MTNSYLNISDKFDNSALVDLLRTADAVAKGLGIPFFVVGATARDIVLWYGYGINKILQILERELDGEGDLPLVVKSAASSPQIEKTLAYWEAIRHELKVKQQAE